MLWLSVGLLVFLTLSNLHGQASVASPRGMPGQTPPNISEKRTRTAAQQKIDSQLLMVAQLKRQGLATTEDNVAHDSMGRAAVDISAEVTDNLLATICREGGEVVNSYPQFKAVRAYLTLESLETIAALSEVRVISRAAEAELSGANSTIGGPVPLPPKLRKLTQDNTSRPPASTTHKRRRKSRRHTS